MVFVRDLSHKDKQNYDAVLRMTSESVFSSLSKITDAKGTVAYLDILRCAVNSYLDKGIAPLMRVEKIWYAPFFLRYWREWVKLHPNYTLGNNFVTHNAYMCIELNAHSLIFLLTIQNIGSDVSFPPWLLGSQSCEKRHSDQ